MVLLGTAPKLSSSLSLKRALSTHIPEIISTEKEHYPRAEEASSMPGGPNAIKVCLIAWHVLL